MGLRGRWARLVGLAGVLGFLAAPLAGALAETGCAPCCPAMQAPCDAEGPGCEMGPAERCCQAAPLRPAPPAERGVEAPGSVLPIRALGGPRQPAPPSVRAVSELAARTSPLRRSVVLQI